MTDKLLCIYHRNNLDDFAAAWVVGHYFGFKNVEYVAVDYGDKPPFFEGRSVYIVGFAYFPEHLIPASVTADGVTIIDHRQSTADIWGREDPEILRESGISLCVDTSLSAVGLSWNNFFPGKEMPRLLNVIQNYDLEREQSLFGQPIVAGIAATQMLKNQDWEYFTKYAATSAHLHELESEGRGIMNANRVLMDAIIARSCSIIRVMDYRVPIANIPSEFSAIAGDRLAKNYPFSVTYEDNHIKGFRIYSLRSSIDGGIDVGVIAKCFGGIGTKHVAAFTSDIANTFDFLR